MPSRTAAHRLRQYLLEAIEALNPSASAPFLSVDARLYNLLYLRYVEGLTVQESANELNVSPRQAHRDLRRGEESIAMTLWNEQSRSAQKARAIHLSSLDIEIKRMQIRPEPVAVVALLQTALVAVKPLAERRHITIKEQIAESSTHLYIDPAMAQQVVVDLLSHVVRGATGDVLAISLHAADEEARDAVITLSWSSASAAGQFPLVSPMAERLIERFGWQLSRGLRTKGGGDSVTLHLAPHGPSILIIDDNEGLVDLLKRYLSELSCRVLSATNGQEGLQIAETAELDAIVLDVMMPEMNGWEVLQRLQSHPRLTTIPIVVCSVFDDPELATALGASTFLAKPVSRTDVLDALQRLRVVS